MLQRVIEALSARRRRPDLCVALYCEAFGVDGESVAPRSERRERTPRE